jgi:ABC-2 type transport system permease protein
MAAAAAFAAFLRRDWTVARSYRLTFALNLWSSLFSLLLFFYLAKLVDEGSLGEGRDLFAHGFFAFVILGIALLQVVQTALNSFAGRVRQEQTTGTLEALLATPTSPSLIVLASAAYELLRALVQGLITLIAAVLIFGLHLEAGPAEIAVSIAALAAVIPIFAALGVVVAAFTVAFKQTLGITGVISSALGLLGGVYFPVDVLPGALETLGRALPFTWALDVIRSALLIGEIELVPLAGVVAAAPVALGGALLVFRLALDRARRDGSLAQY